VQYYKPNKQPFFSKTAQYVATHKILQYFPKGFLHDWGSDSPWTPQLRAMQFINFRVNGEHAVTDAVHVASATANDDDKRIKRHCCGLSTASSDYVKCQLTCMASCCISRNMSLYRDHACISHPFQFVVDIAD